MIQSDFIRFCEALDKLKVFYPKWVQDGDTAKAWFQILNDFSINDVRMGFFEYTRDPDLGRYPPTPGAVISKIQGDLPAINLNYVITQAMAPTAPLGAILRLAISTCDIHAGGFQLKEAAEYCLSRIPVWEKRISESGFTKRELEVMVKYSIDPLQPFATVRHSPVMLAQINERLRLVSAEQEAPKLDWQPLQGDADKMAVPCPEVARQILEMFNDPAEPPDPDLANVCPECVQEFDLDTSNCPTCGASPA